MADPLYEDSSAVEETPSYADSSPTDEPVYADSEPAYEGSTDISTWRKLTYGFKSMPSDVENAGIWMESRFPLGSLSLSEGYTSPKELYGEDFMDLSPDDRRQRIVDVRKAELNIEYPDIAGTEVEDSIAVTIGGFGGILATPTTITPIGKSYKVVAAIGAAIGGTDAALYGLAQEGEIKPKNVGVAAIGGAILAPAMVATLNGLLRGSSSIINRKQVRANEILNNIDKAVIAERATGKSMDASKKAATKKLQYTDKEVDSAYTTTGRTSYIPTVKEAKELVAGIEEVGGSAYKAYKSSLPNDLIEPISTRIRKISGVTADRLQRLEFDLTINTHRNIVKVNPFLDELDKLRGRDKVIATKALFNQDFKTVRSLLDKQGLSTKNMKVVEEALDSLHTNLTKAGYKVGKLTDYFPRYVKDVDGLLATFGKVKQGRIDTVMKKSTLKKGSSLTIEEKSDIIDKVLRGYHPKGVGGTKLESQRTIENLTEDQLKFYATPKQSIHTYIRRAVSDVEKKKFFGESLPEDKGKMMDTIGSFIAKEADAGRLRYDQVEEMQKLLSARFTIGEVAMAGWLQDTKNVLYMATLANPLSALTQIGDVGLSAYLHGFRNTMLSVLSPKLIKAVDVGITDIAQEFSSTRTTAKVLDRMLSLSLFKGMDKMGKSTALTASLRKWRKLSKSPKGIEEIEKRWGKIFGNELPALMDDLQNKVMSDNVRFIAFSDLLRIQPVALSEMPIKYLENPNGRVFYMLKTFTVKQINLMREEIFSKMKSSPAKATKELIRFTVLFGGANIGADTLKHVISGRELEADDVGDLVVNNLFKNFGGSNYLASRFASGKVGEGILNIVAPPLNVIDMVGGGLIDMATDEDFEMSDDVLKNMPLAGKIWYYWLGEGKDKWEERHD